MELLVVFPPLFAFFLVGLFGKSLGDKGAQIVTCASVIVAAISSIILFFDVAMGGEAYTTTLGTWVQSGDFAVNWALKIDALSVVMLCVVTIVSACVHVYSVGYMSHDKAKARFMAYLSLFTFAMLIDARLHTTVSHGLYLMFTFPYSSTISSTNSDGAVF